MALGWTGNMQLPKGVKHKLEMNVRSGKFDLTQAPALLPAEMIYRFGFDVPTIVKSIAWEIMTRNEEDLLSLLWSGSLRMERLGQRWELGSLGSYTQAPFPAEKQKHYLERLAECGERGPEEWRQSHYQLCKLGGGCFFKGMRGLKEAPMQMERGAGLSIRLGFPDNAKLENEARITVLVDVVEVHGSCNYLPFDSD